ncbi:hypothetical protein GOP47_0018520 [Adiantum capillus-veneris]|uniref:F-box domain-containing protein n=1 Tax=Adiantum capillus-veneris TaxID=13818 RepID=A0A9D4UET9_ADICA|nr:hypothetical protein GOP47_0018520 [Adiantum capillus-veneris]
MADVVHASEMHNRFVTRVVMTEEDCSRATVQPVSLFALSCSGEVLAMRFMAEKDANSNLNVIPVWHLSLEDIEQFVTIKAQDRGIVIQVSKMEGTDQTSRDSQEGKTSERTSPSNVEQTAEDTNKPLQLPAEALYYALPYMNLQELLSMEQVCRASREWVRDGVLLWRRLHLEEPLNYSVTDEVLCCLSKRSNGQLECLCLVDCVGITEAAVEKVVLMSPRLTKLFLPGCTGISADFVVKIVKVHTGLWGGIMPGLKELKLRNIRGVTDHHLQTLATIMGMPVVSNLVTKPQFFHEDDYPRVRDLQQRPIDVEVCPKCRDVGMVYDCTRLECQAKQECRACAGCTVRCNECGVCLQDDEHNETVCFDVMCLNCWLRLPKCAECHRPACGRHLDHSFEHPQFDAYNTIECGSLDG